MKITNPRSLLGALFAGALLVWLVVSCGGGEKKPASEAELTETPEEVFEKTKPAVADQGQRGAWTGAPDPQVIGGPGSADPDIFHPDNAAVPEGTRPALPEPRRGGRVIVHLAEMPRHINYMTENSAVAHWLLYEVHEFLLNPDWETWEYTGHLASGWEIEDTVFLENDERGFVYGTVAEDGDEYVVTPISKDNPLSEAARFAKADVADIQYGTVITMDLHDDVKWHDGKPFDAQDVYFSWQCYKNKTVDCEDVRDKIDKITNVEVLGDHRVRFFYGKQYFLALAALKDLTIVPSHLYNLSDPDNAAFEEGVDPLGEKQGTFVNDHPANVMWVGLGPYKITEFNDQFIEAARVDDYFDADRGGYVDTIRWRSISNDDAAKAAVLNGELDYWARLRSEDYFGDFCKSEEFLDDYYAGYTYQPRMQYVAWNTRRPQFKDARVRKALGHSFDWNEFLRTQANGLGVRVTGTQFYLSPNYDHTLEPIQFDLEAAEELLDEAGWYDRDGDGIRDKDGVAFTLSYLMTPGNKASETIALKLQENLGKIGIKLSVETREWASFIERCKQKDFDAFGMGWVLEIPESDPYQLWHSWEGEPGKDRGSNYPGLADPEVDELIGKIQLELDQEKRIELFKRMQRRIYELQPYMFTYVVPIKFAMSKRVRNFRNYCINPGYSIRDWFIVED